MKQLGNKIRSGFISFMQSRNGADGIFTLRACIYFLLCIVNFFAGSAAVSVLEQAIRIYMLFRFLSKNIFGRRAENAHFILIPL